MRTRRLLLWALAVLALTGSLLAVRPAAPPAEAAGKPNIVMVMMDDMRWDELRFAPNVRRYMSSRGITFANSYSPLPLCCPARASFLLGQLPHNHGVMTVWPPYAFASFDDSSTIAGALQRAGYQTGMVGKYLNGYGFMTSRVTGGPSLRYEPAGWTDWMAGVEASWPAGSGLSGGTYNYLSFTQNINRRIVMHPGVYSSTLIGRQARALVAKYHKSDKPFFLYLTPVAPHNGGPREAADPPNYKKANGYVQIFGSPYVPLWARGKFNHQITHAPGVPVSHLAEPDITDKLSEYYPQYLENTATEKRRLRYVERQRAESIYAWDVQFGKLVQKLKDTGEYADTILMFTSDNGYYMGEHRHPPGKLEHHEVSARVPLVVAGPGVRQGRRFAPATTPDLTSTILDLAGAAPLPSMDGMSLRPVLTGPDQAWTRPVILEALIELPRLDDTFPNKERLTEFGIRTGRYKYIRYSTGEEELYDLVADPNELHGLQQAPGAAALKARMIAEWEKYTECAGEGCYAPLSPDLQVGVPELASIDANAWAQKDAYYNH